MVAGNDTVNVGNLNVYDGKCEYAAVCHINYQNIIITLCTASFIIMITQGKEPTTEKPDVTTGSSSKPYECYFFANFCGFTHSTASILQWFTHPEGGKLVILSI